MPEIKARDERDPRRTSLYAAGSHEERYADIGHLQRSSSPAMTLRLPMIATTSDTIHPSSVGPMFW
jgi:hypothetical protein